MLHSMTAFASVTGGAEGAAWTLEIRGVNGRGLELRLRLPDGMAHREHAIRAKLSERLSRGNVTLTLRAAKQDTQDALQLNESQLDSVLLALDRIQSRALDLGVTLAQPTAADVLGLRGVIATGTDAQPAEDTGATDALMRGVDQAIHDFCAMRKSEGRALAGLLESQLEEVADLVEQAAKAAHARGPHVAKQLSAALDRVGQEAADVDPARLAQELALLATKADVTEEIDRLRTHILSARDLIMSKGPHGRKLDFLSQEFNREANTLCSKSQDSALTKVGLALKAVIDQMREQIQNVE